MAVLEPPLWNSSNKPINYTRTFIDVPFTGASAVSISVYGYDAVQLLMSTANAANFTAGQRIYIASGLYAGNYECLYSGTTSIHIASSYLGSAAGFAKPMTSETVTIYAGYAASHPANAVFPYQQIAEFTAIPGVHGVTNIDISPYLSATFKRINTPVSGRDYALVLPFEIKLTGYLPASLRYCMNATVTTDALTPRATLPPLGFNAAMQNGEPIHFEDGVVLYTMMSEDADAGPYPITVFGVHGVGNPGGLGYDEIGSTFTIG